MGIKDFFIKKKDIQKEYGTSGTEFSSGIITEEYNTDLQFPKSIEIYDEMRKSDSTVGAILKAIKNPLVSAKWEVKPGGEEKKDIEIAEFVNKNLFKNIKFKCFLRESLSFVDFGFFYFEKIYKIQDGMIEWSRLAPRIPRSHYLWGIEGKEWIDGHPPGITQESFSSDENSEFSQKTIPWEKLILFSLDREGNNYEGVSILRTSYRDYFYKNLLLKIQSIACERYGVGVPFAITKTKVGTLISKIKEALQNLKSNEKSFITFNKDEIDEWGIKSPEGRGAGTMIKDGIEFYDRKIYDSILAGFLNLSTGDGGSNALSKDQSSFFLKSEQWLADYWITIMQEHINKLVDLNYSNVEEYPELTVSDIGGISMDEQINAINTVVGSGLITLTMNDKQIIRDLVKFPRLTSKEVLEQEKEQEENKKKEEEMKEALIKGNKEEKDEKGEEKEEENKEEDVKKKDKELSEKNLKPKPRENAFMKNITEFEKFLQKKYQEAEKIVVSYEKKYKDKLIEIYENAKTERKDGVEVLVYQKSKVDSAEKEIDNITKQLYKELIDSKIEREIFREAEKKVTETLKVNDTYFSDIDRARFDSFVKGYRSNMQGVLYNEPRKIKEQIVLNFGGGASGKLAIEGVKETTFNKNILRLSFVTHPRAAYKNEIYEQSIKDGFTLFKIVVPKNKLKNVTQRPSGQTFKMIYLILTAIMINQMASKENNTPEAVSGLGLHHNSFEYYYPIESSKQTEEEEIAKEQKKKLIKDTEKINK